MVTTMMMVMMEVDGDHFGTIMWLSEVLNRKFETLNKRAMTHCPAMNGVKHLQRVFAVELFLF